MYGKVGRDNSFLHFQPLLPFTSSPNELKTCHTMKQLNIHNIMPKHENDALLIETEKFEEYFLTHF